jgi:hypothetical protein
MAYLHQMDFSILVQLNHIHITIQIWLGKREKFYDMALNVLWDFV